MKKLTTRKYRSSDLETLKEITAICFDGVSIDQNIEKQFGIIADKNWQARKMFHIDDDAEADPNGIFIAEESGKSGKVVGYITSRVNHSTKIGWIPNLAVLPEYQGRGLGKELMSAALKYLKDSGMLYAKIETLEQNEIGKSFYTKVGFKEVARQIHFLMDLRDTKVGDSKDERQI